MTELKTPGPYSTAECLRGQINSAPIFYEMANPDHLGEGETTAGQYPSIDSDRAVGIEHARKILRRHPSLDHMLTIPERAGRCLGGEGEHLLPEPLHRDLAILRLDLDADGTA